LDDGTIDMGTSFDLFDKASHHDTPLIERGFRTPELFKKYNVKIWIPGIKRGMVALYFNRQTIPR